MSERYHWARGTTRRCGFFPVFVKRRITMAFPACRHACARFGCDSCFADAVICCNPPPPFDFWTKRGSPISFTPEVLSRRFEKHISLKTKDKGHTKSIFAITVSTIYDVHDESFTSMCCFEDWVFFLRNQY
jgi:hypothetical protein